MKKLFTLTLLLLAAWVTVQAVPAKSALRTIKQSDGSSIQVRLAGDEWHHSFITSDGYALSRADNGDMYYRTTDGVSTIMAHDAAQRSATEKAFISSNAEKMTLQSLFTTTQSARRSKALAARKASQVPQTGSPHVPVILVNYKDKKFISSDPVTAWQGQISNPNDVSVYQYFVDQSFGKYKPQFDILGPVTLANNRSTYGGNDFYDNDVGVGKMVAEACQGLPLSVDWTKYDNDGDGQVDVVIVLYAGDGEASSYAEDAKDAVWPCQWDLASSDYRKNISLDGKIVSKFAVFNELNGYDRTKLDGIGTFCHEFSHCLDLPDFYETTYANGYFGMGSWSLLDYGSYNNDGYTPCGYTAYERNFMGWFDYTTPQEGKQYTTQCVQDGGIAIKVTSDDPNEYYIIENIQQKGWNAYAPASGLQVTHVNYSATTWSNNTVNNDSKQGMTIIPADNKLKMDRYGNAYEGYVYMVNDEDMKGDLFPYESHNELTATSTPAATLYNSSTNLNKPITKITKNSDGTVSYFYVAGATPATTADAATKVEANSFTANWEERPDRISYTLQVNPKPTATLLMTETFAKCKTAGTANIAKSLNKYMDNTGWTGSYLYSAVGGLRLGSGNYSGSLTSPKLDLTDSNGKVTLVMKAQAYNNDTNVNVKVSIGSNTTTITVPSSTSNEYIVVLDCSKNTTQQLSIATTAKGKIIITDLKIYSGEFTTSASAPAMAPSETRNGDIITITGITDTHYTVTGLNPNTDYQYKVKVVYQYDESAWSNTINVTTTEQQPEPSIVGDVNGDGTVNVMDINCVISILLNSVTEDTFNGRADVNNDKIVNVQDINAIISIMLAK